MVKFDIEVHLNFPTIDRTFVYHYNEKHDLNENIVESSYRDFYEHEAPTLFALYGYAPMDVVVKSAERELFNWKSCYHETLWEVFFDEGGEPWRGDFSRFDTALMGYRYIMDKKNNSKAA